MLAKGTYRAPLKRGRRQVAGPGDLRCIADIPWGNGERAQCSRRANAPGGHLCKQHAKMLAAGAGPCPACGHTVPGVHTSTCPEVIRSLAPQPVRVPRAWR